MWTYKYAPIERKFPCRATRTDHQVVKQRYGVTRLVCDAINATEAKQIARAMNEVERERHGL